eukprot:664127-Pyramimonas_sp.AAC.1
MDASPPFACACCAGGAVAPLDAPVSAPQVNKETHCASAPVDAPASTPPQIDAARGACAPAGAPAPASPTRDAKLPGRPRPPVDPSD